METRDIHYTDFHAKNHEKMLRVASKYKGMGHDTSHWKAEAEKNWAKVILLCAPIVTKDFRSAY